MRRQHDGMGLFAFRAARLRRLACLSVMVAALGSCSSVVGDLTGRGGESYTLVALFTRAYPPYDASVNTPSEIAASAAGTLRINDNGDGEIQLNLADCPSEELSGKVGVLRDTTTLSASGSGEIYLTAVDADGDLTGIISWKQGAGPHWPSKFGFFRAFRPLSTGRLLVLDSPDQVILDDTITVRSYVYDRTGSTQSAPVEFSFDQTKLNQVAPNRFVVKSTGTLTLNGTTQSAAAARRVFTASAATYRILGDTQTLLPGMTRKLVVQRTRVTYMDTISTAVAWTTSDPAVATVDEDGTVHAVAQGTAQISSATYPTATPATVFVVPNEHHRYTAVAVGGAHACGLTTTGRVLCWGENLYYQLGRKAGADWCGESVGPTWRIPIRCGYIPLDVALPEKAVSVAAGINHNCALGVSGTAYCWGNSYGAAGPGDPSKPTAIPGLTFTSISAGGLTSCGVTATKEAWCWGGYNPRGRTNTLGDSSNNFSWATSGNTPSRVRGNLQFDTVSVRDRRVCGLVTTGAVYCWPYNDATGSISYPHVITGASPARLIISTPFMTCGLPASGVPECWNWSDGDDRLVDPPRQMAAVPQGAFITLAPTYVADKACGLAADRLQYCFTAATVVSGSHTSVPWPEAVQLGFSGSPPGMEPQPPRFTCALTADALIMCSGLAAGTGRGILSGTLPPGYIAGQL